MVAVTVGGNEPRRISKRHMGISIIDDIDDVGSSPVDSLGGLGIHDLDTQTPSRA